jgi:hypothetical protein
MTKQVYERNVEELLNAIEACLKSRLILPGLLLLYAGIDIMAWLNRQKYRVDSKPDDFIEWVERYVLPNAGLACNGIDLYAARCSLLHSYTSESRLSRKGRAKQIFYAWGVAPTENLQQLINYVDKYPAIAVHVDNLFRSFQVGVQSFKQTLCNNPVKAKLVYERAGKLFTNLSM